MDTKFSFYEPTTPPRVAADGGGDSTVGPSVMFSDQSNIEENHHQLTTGSNDRCIVASSSYESRDSTVSSSSDSSDNTERANNKQPSAEDNISVAGTAMSSACISISFETTPADEEIEVRKEDGATVLFMMVEGAKWHDVWNRIKENPDEAKIWVTSSGKDNALFSWDVWRRLPLHEACRRQPPPAVVYALLSAYPASAHVESNFGDLALHHSVRCGASAEVANCILAAYPAAVFARDKSGCTPIDILNGTGRIKDHDTIIAALNRTTLFLAKEETVFSWKVQHLELKHKEDKEKQSLEYESMLDEKNEEIEDLKRQLQQEKKATSNLAAKVIQTESVVQQKLVSEQRNMEVLESLEEELLDLSARTSSRKTKITELEGIIESDRKTIIELTEVIETLRAQLISICEEEEQFAADNLAKAEANLKAMFETQYIFLKQTEKRKEVMRERISSLGISMSASTTSEEEEEDAGDEEKEADDEKEEEDSEDEEEEQSELTMPSSVEQSDDEVAKIALASAKQAVEPLMQLEEGEVDDSFGLSVE
eukprot:scaffold3316_cov94-Skeletonema_marinoi.AAC.8